MEGMYFRCSENKGADQLRGYREADLRLCFRICKKPVFSQRGTFDIGAQVHIILTSPLNSAFVQKTGVYRGSHYFAYICSKY